MVMGTIQFLRGANYFITVKNPDNVQKGVKSMLVNGKPVDGCIVPFDESVTEYNVEVVMG